MNATRYLSARERQEFELQHIVSYRSEMSMNCKPLCSARDKTQHLLVKVITNNWLTHRMIARELRASGKITVLPYQDVTTMAAGDIEERTVIVVDHLALFGADIEMLTFHARQQSLVFLTDSPADEICRFLLMGIRGFVRYQDIKLKLARAIKLVADGHLYVPRDVMEQYVSYTQAKLRAKCNTDADLTPRQRQIMVLLERRYANKEISSMLHISENTVKFHIAKLFNKLGVHDRHQVADLSRTSVHQRSSRNESRLKPTSGAA